MNYRLYKFSIDSPSEQALTKDEYEEILRCREILSEAFSFEEKYSMVIGNYSELEKSVLGIAVDEIVYDPTWYGDMNAQRELMHRRIINLLTATKLYRDTVVSHTVALIGASEKDRIKRIFSDAYDQNEEFRFIEAYRNHVQYKSVQIDLFSVGGAVVKPENIFTEKTLYCGISKSSLEKNSKFKALVLKEMPDEVNLLFYIRRYVEIMDDCHKHCRTEISSEVDRAKTTISSRIEGLRTDQDKTEIFVHIEVYDQDELHERTGLTLQWDKVREHYIRRSRMLVGLGHRFASGKSIR